MDLKPQEINGKAVGGRMRGECPAAGVGAPGSGAPRFLSLTAFPLISCGLRSILVALCGFEEETAIWHTFGMSYELFYIEFCVCGRFCVLLAWK